MDRYFHKEQLYSLIYFISLSVFYFINVQFLDREIITIYS